MLHCLVYFSTSTGLLPEEELVDILARSRTNNARLGITGVLLYVKGSIIQVLEGPKEMVEALYQHIRSDPRHKKVFTVLNRPITERLFAQWDMGYQTIDASQLSSLTTLINSDTSSERDTYASDHVILKMIRLFYNSNRHN